MTPYINDPDFTLHVGDALETLRELPDESVDCVVTSPPYWGLRDYGTGEWAGGDPDCDHRVREDARIESSTLGGGKATTGHQREGFKDACPRCGARRVDQQLGLEPTPDAYVARMVEVFREVRRVLARHGTCWVNLGDSYAGSWGNQGRKEERGTQRPINGPMLQQLDGRYPQQESNTGKTPPGLKPKDLVGIPWKVAQALQAPYYTGRLKNEADRAWLAGFMDGEGTISYVERDRGPDHSPTHDIRAFITNTNGAVLQTFRDLFDAGRVYHHDGERENRYGSRACYRWQMGTHDSALLIRELYPYLRTKKKQAVLVWNLYTTLRHKRGHARTPADVLERRRQIADLVRRLNRGEDVDIPSWCEPPEGMWEEGWFLRSDIIWSKPNPMPESVTDRPTKAHEYIFLLTKNPRYWFDAEAVREEYAPKTLTHRGGGKAAGKVGQQDATGRVASGNFGEWDKPRTAFPPPKPQTETLDGSNGEAPRGPDGRRVTHVQAGGGSIQHRDGERWPNGGRNIRSVWEIATQPYPEAHFATFPEELARRCILAGCPVRVCRVCGKPSERIVERERRHANGDRPTPTWANDGERRLTASGRRNDVSTETHTLGWSDCGCLAPGSGGGEWKDAYRPGVVLDPFLGSGTTALVARNHGRYAIGIELSAEYAELAAKRTRQLSLLAT